MSRKKANVEGTETDLTSMIDVCFLLIAFFIMVTEISKSEIVEIFLPHASYAAVDIPKEDRVIINIDRKGGIFIRSTSYGKPNDTTNKAKILNDLRTYSRKAGYDEELPGRPSKLTIMVRADAHAEYRFVQCIMMLLTDPDVKVRKVHYQAKSPVGSGD
ncbi:MAG: biopolymer transporter ExbD [Planctomycetes bacterium]|nr:biopolymer transporter ExbD [Planctomycetota bacterium]